ncbi:MAG TPA: heme ABC transporter ATP-binding protein [Bauldia sp.]|nr:heme ABC transporter ATP-binding protein [Bauldia sp.]
MLEARGISVQLSGREVLTDADLTIAPGRIVVLIGPNGAGKSTLLRAAAGALKPVRGTVTIDGKNISGWSAAMLAARRAVLAQSVTLTMAYTAGEIVRLGVPVSMRNHEVDTIVGEALAAVEMAHAAERLISALSGGEQQRVHAARVLAQIAAHRGPTQYLLLDEPTTHLDPAQQRTVLQLARRVAASGAGVLAVLHDVNVAAAIADEIVVLSNGRVVERGSPAALTPELLGRVYGVPFHIAESAMMPNLA